MVKVTIGNKEHEVPTPYNFRKIKRAWPHMERAANASDDAIQAIDSIIAVIAIGLLPPHNDPDGLTDDQRKILASGDTETIYTIRLGAKIDEIEEALLGPEVAGLKDAALEIMRENGLLKKAGAAGLEGNGPAAVESPSTEISTESSQNLSQPGVPVATGTE